MQLKRSGPNRQIEKVLYSIIAMQGHTHLWSLGRTLLEHGWDVLLHPPYSPDFAPSDYFWFRSLQNSLNGKNFNNDDDVKSYLIQFFANKNQKSYERGIMMLPERWEKVIDQNEQFITE
ncbi:ccmar2 transposase [Trichonephila clavipes]|nr:ccmar2 transposase [Trichonephila clavipes]